MHYLKIFNTFSDKQYDSIEANCREEHINGIKILSLVDFELFKYYFDQ